MILGVDKPELLEFELNQYTFEAKFKFTLRGKYRYLDLVIIEEKGNQTVAISNTPNETLNIKLELRHGIDYIFRLRTRGDNIKDEEFSELEVSKTGKLFIID